MDYTVQAPDGSEHVITGPDGATDEQILQQAQALLTPGAGESAGRAFVNNLPLGGQVGALGTQAMTPGGTYSQGMEEWNQKAAAAKAAHPIAYGAGAVAGGVAPAAIPGIGELGIAGNAALGAAYGVGNEDLTKDPTNIAKKAAIGAGIGGAIGAIAPSGKGMADKLESYAGAKSLEGAGLSPKMLGGLSEDEASSLGNRIHDWGLDTGSIQERFDKADALKQELGAKVGSYGDQARILEDPTPFTDALHSEFQSASQVYKAGSNPEAGIYEQGIANLQQPGQTFESLQNLKKVYGKVAFDSAHQVKNQAAADVYTQIKAAMDSIIQKGPADYQNAMHDYADIHDISTGIENQLGAARAGGVQAKGFGMIGKLSGMISGAHPMGNVATAAAAGASGHPFMAMGALTPILTNPEAMGSLARTGAQAVPAIAAGAKAGATAGTTDWLVNHIKTNPEMFGRHAPALQQAYQTGGAQGAAATNFVLSGQDPEYNKRMMDARMAEGQ